MHFKSCNLHVNIVSTVWEEHHMISTEAGRFDFHEPVSLDQFLKCPPSGAYTTSLHSIPDEDAATIIKANCVFL